MTIAQLKELIQYLPDDMRVVLPTGEETYTTACYSQSEVVSFPIEDSAEEEGFSFQDAFLILPCTCNEKDIPVVPQDQIMNPN